MNASSSMHRVSLHVLLVLFAAIAFAACGGGDGDESDDRDDRGATPSTTTSTTGDARGGDEDGALDQCSTQSQLYLVRGEKLGVAHHLVDYEADDCGANEPMLEAAMRELLAAPTSADRTAGLDTTIPTGTKLLELSIDDDLATVDLSARYGSGGGSSSMTLRVAQVVATLTAISGVDRVAFRLDGAPVDSIGGEGVLVDPPRTTADIEDQLPAILLEDPAPGDCIGDPDAGDRGTLHVAGTANVFEAVLFAELRRGSRVLETSRIEASSGTGTRGEFEASIPLEQAAGTDQLTLRTYSRSPRDGSEVNVVEVALDPSC